MEVYASKGEGDRNRIIKMTNKETVAHLREWVKHPPKSIFAWPTDACGYDQHIKFVKYRNKYWFSMKDGVADWPNFNDFVLHYADKLERGEL